MGFPSAGLIFTTDQPLAGRWRAFYSHDVFLDVCVET